MLYSYLYRYRTKFCRFVLCINLLICLIILIYHDIEDKTVLSKGKNLTNDRLISHARFFERSSSSCNVTDGFTTEQQQQDLNEIRTVLHEFNPQMVPAYPEKYFTGRGIVLILTRKIQLSQYKFYLKMIEYIQTRLSVQLWYSSEEFSNKTINTLLRYISKLNVSACSLPNGQCQTINKTWYLNSSYIFPSSVILSSTFEEILFLDINSYLVRDPEYVFQSDPMYQHFGALFFPNILTNQSSSVFISKLLNKTCIENEYEFDNKVILVNKKRVWKALYMTNFLNDRLVRRGFRDIFRLAFRFLNVEYYMIGIPCSTGHYNGTHFCGFTTCKTDSLGRYIFINQMNLMKFINAGYSSYHLEYTSIGLGDSYNQSLHLKYCPSTNDTTCLFINMKIDRCLNKPIDQSEIDHYAYGLNEPLTYDDSRILMSETNNLMPAFIASLFHYRRIIYQNQSTRSYYK